VFGWKEKGAVKVKKKLFSLGLDNLRNMMGNFEECNYI
jgi:hypothetical protein